MGHTPGPWETDMNYVNDKNGKEIGHTSYKQDGYVRGNTLLFAAAPDLLEACEEAYYVLKRSGADLAIEEMLRNTLKKAGSKAIWK